MYISVALMMDQTTDEWVHSLALKLHQSYKINLEARKLGAHVSLKLVYQMDDLKATCEILETLSKTLTSFPVSYEAIEHIKTEYHILWLSVVETIDLRKLHDLLNRALPVPLGVNDGPNFHFHSTIAIGKEEVFDQVTLSLDRPYVGKAVALVVSTSETGKVGSFKEVKRFKLKES